jgi:hypothetical protein
LNDKCCAGVHEQHASEHRQTGEAVMQVRKVSPQVAWSEREARLRSAKRSAAVVVATLAALLISASPNIYAARQTFFQRIQQEYEAQWRASRARAKQLVGQDWKKWTAADCDIVLNYSNWALPSGMTGALSGRPVIQLRSALPVREALLRQLQLKKRYDTMDTKQKLAFDSKNPPEIIENESDPILLYVEHDTSFSTRRDDSGSIDPAQQAAIELADGTLIMPIKTEALGWIDEIKMVYSFPRVINGKPVLSGKDQQLNFVFGAKLPAGGYVLPLQNPVKFQINHAKFVDMRLL